MHEIVLLLFVLVSGVVVGIWFQGWLGALLLFSLWTAWYFCIVQSENDSGTSGSFGGKLFVTGHLLLYSVVYIGSYLLFYHDEFGENLNTFSVGVSDFFSQHILR